MLETSFPKEGENPLHMKFTVNTVESPVMYMYLEKMVTKFFLEKISTLISFVVSQQFAHISRFPLVSLG